MDKKFFIETENFTNNNNAEINSINPIQITKDMVLKNILRLCTDLVRVRFIDVVFLKIFYKRYIRSTYEKC